VIDYKRKTREEVARMHALYETGCSLEEVGCDFNLTRERVRQLFVKFGFPTRRYSTSPNFKRRRAEHEQDKLIKLPKEELERFYAKNTIRETAARFGVGTETVKSNLLGYGIPLRSRTETRRIKYGNPALTEEVLRRLYTEEGKTAKEIAAMFGYSVFSVKRLVYQSKIRKFSNVSVPKPA
jgi:hypothetical protein